MENRIYKIKEKCDEILSFNMWFNLSDSFFWPIIELIDIDSDFLINLYSTVKDKYLEILYHNTIIIPVIESIMNFSKNNSHEYFKYIHAYWLRLYFNRACRVISHPKKIEFYKKHLSEIFPNGYF